MPKQSKQLTEIPPRYSGWRHLFAATQYSFGGLKRLMQESAFRQELLLLPGVLILHLLFSAEPIVLVLSVVLFLLLIAIEAVNTAIECLVDHLSPEWAEFAKHAKDLGSFAVFCLLLANGLLAGFSVISAFASSGAAL